MENLKIMKGWMKMFQLNKDNRCGCQMPQMAPMPQMPCIMPVQQQIGGCQAPPKTNIAPAVCHPVQEKVIHTYETTIVPHIYPKHTKMIHHHVYQTQNHYPHTVSNETEQCCVQQNCGC